MYIYIYVYACIHVCIINLLNRTPMDLGIPPRQVESTSEPEH